ncbi:hypothetical protein [Vibrio fluvialis]|uniref:hypothetical protein n=1 Tax=Vibrio fluvialis TaxID=676 RepID=UPI00399A4C55
MQEEQILHNIYFNKLVRLGISKREACLLLERNGIETVKEIIRYKREETMFLRRNAESSELNLDRSHFAASKSTAGRVLTFRPRIKNRKLSCRRPRSKVEKALLMASRVKSEADPLKTLGIIKSNKDDAWLESLFR